MIFIHRKELLELLKENDIADKIVQGPVALFFTPKKGKKKQKKIATIVVSLHNSLIITKYNNFFIPIHIYRLHEISKNKYL